MARIKLTGESLYFIVSFVSLPHSPHPAASSVRITCTLLLFSIAYFSLTVFFSPSHVPLLPLRFSLFFLYFFCIFLFFCFPFSQEPNAVGTMPSHLLTAGRFGVCLLNGKFWPFEDENNFWKKNFKLKLLGEDRRDLFLCRPARAYSNNFPWWNASEASKAHNFDHLVDQGFSSNQSRVQPIAHSILVGLAIL